MPVHEIIMHNYFDRMMMKNMKIMTLFAMTILIGILDVITTSHFRLYIFYLIPLFIASYFYTYRLAYSLLFLSYLFIFYSDYLIDHRYSVVTLWNDSAIIIMFIFFIVANIRIKEQQRLEREKAVVEEEKMILDRSLQGQKLLVREMYHRLKNHINELISLIALHEARQEENIANVMKTRLYVYASLFSELCYDEHITQNIGLYDFLRQFIHLFKQSLNEEIVIQINQFDINVTYNMSKTVGLLLHELLTNSVKYAFHDFTHAEITIQIAQEQNRLKIRYHDNGKGVAYDLAASEKHLGVFIINTLVNQCNGHVIYTNQQGANYEIELVLDDEKDRNKATKK